MAHVSMNDIRQLWDETPQRSWPALVKTLQRHRTTTQGISNTLITALIPVVDKLENSGQAYPSSRQGLFAILNQRLQPSVQAS